MKYWSVGLKSGNGSDFYSFTFDYPRSKHGLYFPLISTIHQSITPVLQVLLPSSFVKERMTTVYQQL
jgi:hypothetical protein